MADEKRPPLDQPTRFMPVTCSFCDAQNLPSMSFDRDVSYDAQPVQVYMDVEHVRVGTGPSVPSRGDIQSQDWLEPHYEYRCPRCRYVESHEKLVADR